MLARRGLFLGAAALLAAPSIVRAQSLMPGSTVPFRFNRVLRYQIDFGTVYGRSPLMSALGDAEEVNRCLYSLLQMPPRRWFSLAS